MDNAHRWQHTRWPQGTNADLRSLIRQITHSCPSGTSPGSSSVISLLSCSMTAWFCCWFCLCCLDCFHLFQFLETKGYPLDGREQAQTKLREILSVCSHENDLTMETPRTISDIDPRMTLLQYSLFVVKVRSTSISSLVFSNLKKQNKVKNIIKNMTHKRS